jgi:hypothetical protein
VDSGPGPALIPATNAQLGALRSGVNKAADSGCLVFIARTVWYNMAPCKYRSRSRISF